MIEWIAGFSACCLCCLYQPFIKLWIGKENLLEVGVVICIAIYLYIIITNQMLCLYKDASGIWHQDRYRPLITAIANLTMNLLTVKWLGLYGVILSTVLSLIFIGSPWLIYNLFTYVFKRNSREFILQLFYSLLASIIAAFVTYFACSFIYDAGYFAFFVKFLICIILPNVVIVAFIRRIPAFHDAMTIVNNMTNGKLFKLSLIRNCLGG